MRLNSGEAGRGMGMFLPGPSSLDFAPLSTGFLFSWMASSGAMDLSA